MANGTTGRAAVGDRLQCVGCGTQVRMETVGGGRMECCDQPLTLANGAVAVNAVVGQGVHARCTGCGNEVGIERDGGGSLSCCADPMLRG